jgi:hypothetical protein
MLKVFKSQLGLVPKIIVSFVVGALFLGVGTISLYQQLKNQPEALPATGADMTEEERIRVLFPKGGETLEIGRTFEIRWENYLGKEPLIIALQVTTPEGIVYQRIIDKNVPATTEGVYNWTVTSERLDGKYKIEIYPPGGAELTGRSEGYFSIMGDSLITVNTPQLLEGVGGIMLVPSKTGPSIVKGDAIPIRVTGQARHVFSEGEFFVRLTEMGLVWDENRGAYYMPVPLDEAIARAKTDDWMAGEWTDFEAELLFTAEQVRGKTQFLAMIGFYPRDGLGNGKLIYEFPVVIGKTPAGMSAELIVDSPVARQTVASPITISGRVREGFIEGEFRVELKGYLYRWDHPRYLEGGRLIQSTPVVIGDRYWCDWTDGYWRSFTATIRYAPHDVQKEGGHLLNFYDVRRGFVLALPVKLE